MLGVLTHSPSGEFCLVERIFWSASDQRGAKIPKPYLHIEHCTSNTSSWLQITGFPLFFFRLLIHIGFISNGKAFATPRRWKVVEKMFIRIFKSELYWTDSLHFVLAFWLNNTHLGMVSVVVWNISYLHNWRVRFFVKMQIRTLNQFNSIQFNFYSHSYKIFTLWYSKVGIH